MLDAAVEEEVAFLVVGDTFGYTTHPFDLFHLDLTRFYRATTHSDLFVRAKQRGIQVQVFHNASIMNAV